MWLWRHKPLPRTRAALPYPGLGNIQACILNVIERLHQAFVWSCRLILNKQSSKKPKRAFPSHIPRKMWMSRRLGNSRDYYYWERERRCRFRKRGIPAGGVGGNTGVPHLGVSGPADLGSVWNPWHLSCIPGWIGAISVMDWGRRAGSRGWIRLNLYTGHMCAHDNMDAFFLCWVILIRLPGCCLEQPCFAAIFSLHQKRTMAPPKEGVNACFWNWRQKLL